MGNKTYRVVVDLVLTDPTDNLSTAVWAVDRTLGRYLSDYYAEADYIRVYADENQPEDESEDS